MDEMKAEMLVAMMEVTSVGWKVGKLVVRWAERLDGKLVG